MAKTKKKTTKLSRAARGKLKDCKTVRGSVNRLDNVQNEVAEKIPKIHKEARENAHPKGIAGVFSRWLS